MRMIFWALKRRETRSYAGFATYVPVWLEYLHYGRLQFVILALSSVAVCSKVLIGHILWQPLAIVGLSTYALYSLDNLLDWPGERLHLGAIASIWRSYAIWCSITIPLALLGAGMLAAQRSIGFLALLGSFGALALFEIVLTRQLGAQQRSAGALWAERLADSLTWALVVALVPIFYSSSPIVAQVAMTIAYAWHLSWINVMIWDLTRSATGGLPHQTPTLAPLIGEHRVIRMLQILCVCACALAVIDIALGYFPWYNIAVIAAPLADIGLLALWQRLRRYPRLYGGLFPLANMLGSLLVIAVYRAAE